MSKGKKAIGNPNQEELDGFIDLGDDKQRYMLLCSIKEVLTKVGVLQAMVDMNPPLPAVTCKHTAVTPLQAQKLFLKKEQLFVEGEI